MTSSGQQAGILAPPRHSNAMNYKSSSERIVGGPRWPGCVNANPDWAQLFGNNDDDDVDEDDIPWLTPRMAMKIHNVAFGDAGLLLQDLDCTSSHPRLPKVARPFFKTSENWRLAFRDCYVRIGLRLQKGLDPTPNCTGEEMAFYNIMDRVPDAFREYEDGYEEYDALPNYPNDDDYDDYQHVSQMAVVEDEVLMLFETDDQGYDSTDDEDETNVHDPWRMFRSNSAMGSMANVPLEFTDNRMRAGNLHPRDWFLAFDNVRFQDHF